MGADTEPLCSGVDELEAAYEDLSSNINSVWGPQNSYVAFCKSREIDWEGRPDYKHRERSELAIPQADFHKELLRSIRRIRMLIAEYPVYGPEIKLHLSRWTQILIEVMAARYEETLTSVEPINKSERDIYNYAYAKLHSAVSLYRFLNQPDPAIPIDPSTRWKLPRWIGQLLEKQTREPLISLLKDPESFSPTDVDAILIYLGAIDKESRKWIKTKAGKGGNQSMFPAAYAALHESGKVRDVPSVEWVSIFKTEYNAELSDSTAEKWAQVRGKGREAIDKHYVRALQWLDTPPAERDNL